MKKKILIFAGGTLGHVKPALSLTEGLKNDYQILFVTTNNNVVKDYVSTKDIDVLYFDCPGYNRKKVFSNIKSLIILLKTKIKINRLIKDTKPDLLIGFGGSISTIGLSTFKNIKKIIHEQNAYEGLGNKIIRKIYKPILLSAFPIKGYRLVGNPLISDYAKLKSISNNDVLIFGGSLGSKFICTFFIDNFEKIQIFKGRKVIMITGNNDYDQISKKAKNFYNLQIIKSTNNIEKYYQQALLVITRAGAGTLSEIIGLNKPALVIPSPNVTNNHQLLNAKYYQKLKVIRYLEEKDVNCDNVNKIIDEILSNSPKQNQELILSKNKMINEIKKVIGD